jgi:hypothetical protein
MFCKLFSITYQATQDMHLCTICVLQNLEVSQKSCSFAADMKKKILYFVIAMLYVSTSTQAQMFVCSNDSCESFDHTQDVTATFADDSLWVGRLGYRIAAIDSIVFCQPSLQVIQPLGCWGNISNGSSQYIARSKDVDRIKDNPHIIVTFRFQAKEGICLSAHCFVSTTDDSALIVEDDGNEEETPEMDTSTNNDPYIYVKETQTGVRKLEVWIMYGPVLPNPELWEKSNQEWRANCSSLLVGRTMSEVKAIVETWLHQKGEYIPASQV